MKTELDCGDRGLILENKKSSPTLSLQNLAASVVETVICRQNSWLYGVYRVAKAYSQKVADLPKLLLDFSLTVKAATLIFISGRCSAISSASRKGNPVLFIIW